MRYPRVVSATVLSIASGVTAQGGFPRVPVPAGNPITVEKTMLGKALFFEEQMSSSRRMACATCHLFGAGGSDPRAVGADSIHPGRDGRLGSADDVRGSKGQINSLTGGKYERSNLFGLRQQVTDRRSMTVINAAFAPLLFWDGRASAVFRGPNTGRIVLSDRAALESQSVGPPLSPVEMCSVGDTWTQVVARIQAARPLALASNVPGPLASFLGARSYPDLFKLAFGTTAITPQRIAFAVATYERSLVSDQSPFDALQRGSVNALTASQRRGLGLFQQRCDGCHRGPLQTDNQFVNTGVRPVIEDRGRQNVTGNFADRGRFRTPTLRNVELRAPYFHNGQMTSLMDVVNFYNRGGDFNDNKDLRVRRLGWSRSQRQDVVNFLLALTDPRVRNQTGPFTRPTLITESTRLPILIGAGTVGANGNTPRMIAEQPPFLGSPGMTIGMNLGAANASAVLLIDGVGDPLGSMLLGARVHLGMSAAMLLVPYGPLNARGYGSVTFPLVNDATLRGIDVYGQWLVADPSAGRSLSATPAFRARLF